MFCSKFHMIIKINDKDCRTNNLVCGRKLKEFLASTPIPDNLKEVQVRKLLLPFVEGKLSNNEWILYDGNTVWNVHKLVKQLKTFVKYYDYDHFTKYLYQFIHMSCGSIAHYDKAGWLNTYPDLDSFKAFFKKNEYGEPVHGYPPSWHYDARKAAEGMHAVLFGPGIRMSYPHY